MNKYLLHLLLLLLLLRCNSNSRAHVAYRKLSQREEKRITASSSSSTRVMALVCVSVCHSRLSHTDCHLCTPSISHPPWEPSPPSPLLSVCVHLFFFPSSSSAAAAEPFPAKMTTTTVACPTMAERDITMMDDDAADAAAAAAVLAAFLFFFLSFWPTLRHQALLSSSCNRQQKVAFAYSHTARLRQRRAQCPDGMLHPIPTINNINKSNNKGK